MKTIGRDVAHALRRLVHGDLAGLFDGPSTVVFDPELPMVSLDAVGGAVIHLGVGRSARLNPLDLGPRPSGSSDGEWLAHVTKRRRSLLARYPHGARSPAVADRADRARFGAR